MNAIFRSVRRLFGASKPSVQRDTYGPVVPEIPVDLQEIDVPRAENFPASGPVPWLDRPDALEQIEMKRVAGLLSVSDAKLCRKWHQDGYIVLPSFFSDEQLEQAWNAYEAAIAAGEVIPNVDRHARGEDDFPGRVLNPHFKVKAVEELLRAPEMLNVISMLLGASALPFQTIIGHRGSEQLAHSDSIHMTTYPQGYLAANWIAFEDIHPESGPLEYYPGSHRIPYAYSREVGIGVEEGRASYSTYLAKYEPFIQDTIHRNQLKPAYFEAKRGDVLIWHANLLHGGSPRRDPQWSRRALVCHYFAEGCLCYHDYTASLSHLHPPAPVSESEFDPDAYLAANPDVADAGADPYRHYRDHGYGEGRPLRPDG